MELGSLLQLNTQQLLLFWGISVVLTYILFVIFLGFYGKKKLSLFYGKMSILSALQIDLPLFIIFLLPILNIMYFTFIFVNREEIIKDLYVELEIEKLANKRLNNVSQIELFNYVVDGVPIVKDHEIEKIYEQYEEKIK